MCHPHPGVRVFRPDLNQSSLSCVVSVLHAGRAPDGKIAEVCTHQCKVLKRPATCSDGNELAQHLTSFIFVIPTSVVLSFPSRIA